jgi:hypothetical protein
METANEPGNPQEVPKDKPTQANNTRRAVIFIPGLDLGIGPDKTIVGVATRLEEACASSVGLVHRNSF